MSTILVAACSVNQTPLAWDHNRDNILSAIKEARHQGIELLCCPELCISGYGCEDAFLSRANVELALTVLEEIVPETENIAVALGLPLFYLDKLYNVVCFIRNRKIQGFVAKQHLAGDGVHYEPRWFTPWPKAQTVDIDIHHKQYPFGDIMFEINNIRIGFEICEDAWVMNRTGIGLAERGVDIILNPSASHFAFGKSLFRHKFIIEAVQNFGVGYVYANLLGNEAGRLIYDGDTILAKGSDEIIEGPRFSFEDRIMTATQFDIQALRKKRNEQRKPVQNVTPTSSKTISSKKEKESEPITQYSEFISAVSLGLFDYLRKSRAKSFVLNLSGGSDSASVACLVFFMVHLALEELGKEKFQAKLSHIPEINHLDLQEKKPETVLAAIFHCLYQRTQNNSQATERAANNLAKNLGFAFHVLDIDSLVTEYCDLLVPVLQRQLSWQNDDIALQNIQSRVRSPSAWLLANVHDAIFLCASNRSEASVGYATIDGDTSGGLCPIAGVDKTFLLNWLSWLSRNEVHGRRFAFLNEILALLPSAELRPKTQSQTDEQDLMPYAWLDTIQRLFVERRQSPLEIFQTLQKGYPKVAKIELGGAIERFCKLWARNQWKRERLAATFHLDDESVDPKAWCRFPILSGGFLRELASMWDYIKKVL